MALPATDSFTNSNGVQLTTHSSNWTLNVGDFDIQSNALASDTAGANDGGAHWNADSFDNDQYAQATCVARAAGPFAGPAVRAHASAATYYGYYSDADEKYLFKMVSNSWTELGFTATPWSVSDVARIEAESTTITPMLNGSTDTDIGAQTDSSISSGSAGVCGYTDGTTTRIDDWQGGNLAVNTAPNKRPFGINLGMSRRLSKA